MCKKLNTIISDNICPLGRWGRMRKEYLQECNPALYNRLLLSHELWDYLNKFDNQAQARYESVVEQLKANASIAEELKNQHSELWSKQMNSICIMAEDVIMHEMIYSD